MNQINKVLILLDLHGVLIKTRNTKGLYAKCIYNKDFSYEMFREVYYNQFSESISEEELIKELNKSGAEVKHKISSKLSIRINKQLLSFLFNINNHCDFGIVSDIDKTRINAITKLQSDFFDIFKIKYLSCRTGFSKFKNKQKLFDKIKIENNHYDKIIYIDDKLEYITYATNAGFVSIIYKWKIFNTKTIIKSINKLIIKKKEMQ